jgi:Tfp pilus assembly major pilin PilA
MKSSQKKYTGFGAIELLLVLVIIAILGLIGWYVLNVRKNTTESYDNAAKASTPAPTPAATKATEHYITITEWGVRVPVPGNVELSDIYYVTGTVAQDSASPEVGFGSHKLDAITSDCIPKAGVSESPFGWIEKMTPDAYQKSAEDSQSKVLSSGTKFGDYYYVWQVPRANCYANQNQNAEFKVELDKLTDNGNRAIDNFPVNMSALLEHIQVIPK